MITPLNWGLGHASRSIPIIQALIKKGCSVLIGSDGSAAALLKKEFPQLTHLKLPSYNIQYEAKYFTIGIAAQFPKILRAVYQEYQLTQKLVKEYGIDAIISDNRYGCRHSHIPSVFITHQVNLPVRIPFVSQIHQRYLRTFSQVWIPDYAKSPGLAAHLSHAHSLKQAKYIGPLSRLNPTNSIQDLDLLVVLSGPEPDRSKFEQLIYNQLLSNEIPTVLVRGVPKTKQLLEEAENLKIISFASTNELNVLMNRAQVVLCRSGYSSIMDLSKMNKRAILVPSPGQPEQLYLAAHLASNSYAVIVQQKNLDISENMKAVKTIRPIKSQNNQLLDEVLNYFLQQL